MKLFRLAAVVFGFCGMFALGCGSKGSTGPAGPQGPQGNQGPILPSVSAVNPAPGSVNVALDSVVRASFTKSMDASTLNSSTFVVSAGGTSITGTISYNAGSQTVYFTPGLPLTAFTAISAVLTTGVKDAGGTALAQNYSWSFSTGGSFAQSKIYQADVSIPGILVYNNGGSATGNISPDRNISGAATLQNWSSGIWLDSAADRLYVVSSGSNAILVFNNASRATGNIAPSRNITGAATTLNTPGGIWLDSANDSLYVVNGLNSILVFTASTANGNVAPARTISGAATTLNNPYGQIWLDAADDRLYVTNGLASSILVFTASTASGNVAPARTIAGAATTLGAPQGIWLDSASDQLYVADTGNDTILVFTNARTADGNIAPARTITSAGMTPEWIWLDSVTDRLYVANYPTSILVFNGASTANGTVAPARIISGGNTLLGNVRGIWLDSGN